MVEGDATASSGETGDRGKRKSAAADRTKKKLKNKKKTFQNFLFDKGNDAANTR